MKQVVSQYGYGAWNGWLLLIVLAAGLSFLNQFISTRQQGKGAQAAQTTGQPGSGMNMKMMMYMMPLIIVFFSFSYSSAFNIYMVTSSAMTIVINLASTGLLYLMYKNRGDANPKQRPPKSPRTRNAKARPVQPQHSRGYRKP
jgi:membrane protein insertase Oxa1/YidC/SpoIIIJ